ncbi:hypothetical protein NMY22_g11859 [Coprinellus aureogranulatus]|nr:hypothetical protein NMY22_g11859 [Coprinellus aureogranulatus]
MTQKIRGGGVVLAGAAQAVALTPEDAGRCLEEGSPNEISGNQLAFVASSKGFIQRKLMDPDLDGCMLAASYCSGLWALGNRRGMLMKEEGNPTRQGTMRVNPFPIPIALSRNLRTIHASTAALATEYPPRAHCRRKGQVVYAVLTEAENPHGCGYAENRGMRESPGDTSLRTDPKLSPTRCWSIVVGYSVVLKCMTSCHFPTGGIQADGRPHPACRAAVHPDKKEASEMENGQTPWHNRAARQDTLKTPVIMTLEVNIDEGRQTHTGTIEYSTIRPATQQPGCQRLAIGSELLTYPRCARRLSREAKLRSLIQTRKPMRYEWDTAPAP